LKSKLKNKIHKASKNENQPPPENRTRIDSNERALSLPAVLVHNNPGIWILGTTHPPPKPRRLVKRNARRKKQTLYSTPMMVGHVNECPPVFRPSDETMEGHVSPKVEAKPTLAKKDLALMYGRIMHLHMPVHLWSLQGQNQGAHIHTVSFLHF
jgi:hypothetical protein